MPTFFILIRKRDRIYYLRYGILQMTSFVVMSKVIIYKITSDDFILSLSDHFQSPLTHLNSTVLSSRTRHTMDTLPGMEVRQVLSDVSCHTMAT